MASNKTFFKVQNIFKTLNLFFEKNIIQNIKLQLVIKKIMRCLISVFPDLLFFLPTQIDKQTNRQICKQTNRQIDKQTNRQIDKQTNRHIDKQTNRQIDKQTNGQIDKQTNRQIDKQTNRQIDKQTNENKTTINNTLNQRQINVSVNLEKIDKTQAKNRQVKKIK